MKNSNNKYFNYKEITIKPFSWEDKMSFVFSDICYCGHKSKEHTLENNQCSQKESCNCEGFFP